MKEAPYIQTMRAYQLRRQLLEQKRRRDEFLKPPVKVKEPVEFPKFHPETIILDGQVDMGNTAVSSHRVFMDSMPEEPVRLTFWQKLVRFFKPKM